MREIKFRGFIKDLKWMLPIEVINFWSKTLEIDLSSGNGDDSEYEFDEVEIMQYTGIKDKNGKDIYEGDIIEDFVHCDSDEIRQGEVFWGNALWLVNTEQCNVGGLNGFYLPGVIGNIYENPELLEVK